MILLHTENSYREYILYREHHSVAYSEFIQRTSFSTENVYREFIQRIACYSRLQIQTRTHTDVCICNRLTHTDDSFILQPSFYSEFIQRTSFYSEFIQRTSCYSRLHIQTRTHTASVIQPIADRVALNLEIISKKIPTNQNSDHGIYD